MEELFNKIILKEEQEFKISVKSKFERVDSKHEELTNYYERLHEEKEEIRKGLEKHKKFTVETFKTQSTFIASIENRVV